MLLQGAYMMAAGEDRSCGGWVVLPRCSSHHRTFVGCVPLYGGPGGEVFMCCGFHGTMRADAFALHHGITMVGLVCWPGRCWHSCLGVY
jgi:hypothetical protein